MSKVPKARRSKKVEIASTFRLYASDPGSWWLYEGDAGIVLDSEYSDDFFDSCITDPPYGLRKYPEKMIREMLLAWLHDEAYQATGGGFMGRKWDAVVPGPQTFRAIKRKLKPGAHIAAFASSQTQDLMTMSLRLAGFEIRHVIDWMYNDSMPKYRDIGKAIDERAFRAWIAEHRPELKRMAPKRRNHNLHRFWTSTPNTKPWAECSKEERKNWWAWRWCEVATAKYGELWGKRRVVGQVTQTGAKFQAAADTIDNGGFNNPNGATYALTEPFTDEAKQWDGWHTALKSGKEPIIIARKPIEFSTVEEQVLATGTGALNIDACRIGERNQTVVRGSNRDRGAYGGYSHDSAEVPVRATYKKGRWATDVILAHNETCMLVGTLRVRAHGDVSGDEPSETAIFGQTRRPAFESHGDGDGWETIEDWDCEDDCVNAELNRQSGMSKSTSRPRFTTAESQNSQNSMKDGHRGRVSGGFDDEGGAARFFYQINPWTEYPFVMVKKPDRAEKDAGLDHLPTRSKAKEGSGAKNAHQTVKPVALMGYLNRLLTPPGGTILDPFCGSGSTGVPAIREGFQFVGIDITPAHMPLAEGRLREAAKIDPHNLPLFEPLKPTTRQASLLDVTSETAQ